MFGKAFSSQCPLCQHRAVPHEVLWLQPAALARLGGTQPVLPLVPAWHGGVQEQAGVQGARKEQWCVSPQLTLLKALWLSSSPH